MNCHMGTVAAYTDSLRNFISSTTDCIGFPRTERYYHNLTDDIQKLYAAPILMTLETIPRHPKRQNDSQRSPLWGPKSLQEIKHTL